MSDARRWRCLEAPSRRTTSTPRFRVRGLIYATAPTEGGSLHVFVDEEDRDRMVKLYPAHLRDPRLGQEGRRASGQPGIREARTTCAGCCAPPGSESWASADAALDDPPALSRSPRACRALARGAARESGAARRDARLQAPSAARALPRACLASLGDQCLSRGGPCRGGGPRLRFQPTEDRAGAAGRADCGDERPARLRVATPDEKTCRAKSPASQALAGARRADIHPLFRRVRGPVADWERT